MKKNNSAAYTAIFILLFVMVTQHAAAQSTRATQSCYTRYKSLGDAYKTKGNYSLSVQQYKYARYCSGLNRDQIRILDSLIADANRRVLKTKVIMKRY